MQGVAGSNPVHPTFFKEPLVPFFLNLMMSELRAVAQPGSALRSGRRGRWFESSLPDFDELLFRELFLFTTLPSSGQAQTQRH